MNIQEKRKEINIIMEDINEHSDRLTEVKNIPLLELSAIISKTNKLQEAILILKYMLENEKKIPDVDEEYYLNEGEESKRNTVEIEVEESPRAEIELKEVEQEIVDKEEESSESIINEELLVVEETIEKEEEFQFSNSSEKKAEEESFIEEEPLVVEESVEEEEEHPIQNHEEEIEEESVLVETEDLFTEKELSINDIEQNEEISSKPDLNEAFSEKEDSSLSEQLKKQPIGDLLSAIALNERYLYANELFDGDIEDFRRVMGMLNEFENGEEASQFFNGELRQNYGWKDDNEMANALFQLIERRFQS